MPAPALSSALRRRWLHTPAPSAWPSAAVLLPLAAAAIGGTAIGLQYLHVGARPLPSTAILMTAGAAAFAPLRVALPVAVVLACFQSTIGDFFGSPGRYWKEAFVTILVLRALRVWGWPRVASLVTAGAIAVFASYLAAGTPALQLAWAAKILFFSVLAGWAIARLRPDRRAWISTYYGLAVAAGANVLLGAWQRWEGWAGLVRLGLPYGERIRQAPSGAVRAYGGFTTEAPFSYAIALAVLAWVAFAVSREGRRLALRTTWVPVAGLIGIALSLNRIALVGLTAAGLVGALLSARRRPAIVALTAAPLVIVAGVLLIADPATRTFLLKGFTFSSQSAKTRRALWREYARSLTIGGYGPGSAGAAYARVSNHQPESISLGTGWFSLERDSSGRRFNWMGSRGAFLVGTPGALRRPTLVELSVTSLAITRVLDVGLGAARLTEVRVPARGVERFQFQVPGGRGRARVWLTARPPAARAGGLGSRDPRMVSISLLSLTALDGGSPRTEAERIYARVRRKLGPAALGGTAPGVVDNLYLSWLYQYGFVLGALLCFAFIGVLLRPLRGAGESSPLELAMRFWGVFLVVGALAVNIWEEFPTDLIAAIGFAQLYAASRSATGWRSEGSR